MAGARGVDELVRAAKRSALQILAVVAPPTTAVFDRPRLLTDGGADPALQDRQCVHAGRDGHTKPPLPAAVSPPRDARRLSPGETVSGQVGADGADWYAVRAGKRETVSVVTTGNPEGISIALFGPDGSPLDAIDVATPDRTAFGALASSAGTHYVRITPRDGLGGFYRLAVDVAGPDTFDPNDRPSRALPVAAGTTTEASLTEGEADWYAIKLPAGGALVATVTVDGHALGRDLRVELLDAERERMSDDRAAGETRFHPSTGSNTATASAVTPAPGVYYIHVTCAALDGHAAYRLTVETDLER